MNTKAAAQAAAFLFGRFIVTCRPPGLAAKSEQDFASALPWRDR
jgi:hypothetical protein